jgi:hypothetical protein
MWSETQIAYLAGIIDGEGTMYIQRRMDKRSSIVTWSYWTRLQVCNTNPKLIEWIHQTFGGLVYKKERDHIKRNWKTQFEWYSKISMVDILLPLLHPYLIIKKPHAEVMMEFRKTFSKRETRKLTPEMQSFRDECMAKLKHLNNI